jgi:hypothetical protein
MYEPLWDDIVKLSQNQNFRIRSIWMADLWNQGESEIRNEDKLGDDRELFKHDFS